MGRKRNKPNYETIPGYTVKQSQYIRGEIGDDDVDSRFFSWFLKAAKELNDEENIERANIGFKKFKKESANASRQRRKALYHGEVYPLKKTIATKYSKKHLQIIDGSIPADKVHRRLIDSICGIAQNRGDTDIYEKFIKIREERILEEHKNILLRLDANKKNYTSGDLTDEYLSRNYLTKWEIEVLLGKRLLKECPTEHLVHIVKVTQENNDDEYFKLALQLLEYKTNPASLYITQDAEEARQLLEMEMGHPLPPLKGKKKKKRLRLK